MAALAPLMAARGIATFAPNFRGSNGRGVGFAEANHGDMGGADWADIIAGVDRLVADGIADPERLGICGWSYGGFMTMWGVTQTTRFKAAVAGAGIANWASFHGASDLHVWDALFYEADPYDPNSIYAARSPIYHSHRVKTPTLVSARRCRSGRAARSGPRVLPVAERSRRRDATGPLPRLRPRPA